MFNYKDKVSFEINGETLVGEICVINKCRTSIDDSDVSYDIMVKNDIRHEKGKCLYKHIDEKFVKAI